jgi:hypothetical protein
MRTLTKIIFILLFSWSASGQIIVPTSTGGQPAVVNLAHDWEINAGNTGTSATDSIGTDNGTWHGTKLGNAAGGIGSYYSTTPGWGYISGFFDGSSDYISTANTASITPTTPFSIRVIVNANQIPSTNRCIVQTAPNSGNYDGIWFLLESTGQIQFELLATNGNDTAIRTSNSISPGMQHQIVATYDGSETLSGMKIYLDGSLASTTTIHNTGFASFTNRPWFIGSDSAVQFTYFPGTIRGVQIYAAAQSAGWVASDWASINTSYLWLTPTNVSWSTLDDCFMPSNVSLTTHLQLTDSYTTNNCTNSAGTSYYTTKSYTGGGYYTLQPFTYGKFEANMEMAAAESDSTFWLFSSVCGDFWQLDSSVTGSCSNISNANYEEIDVNEYLAQGNPNTIRTQVYGPSGFSYDQSATVSNPALSFHVYDVVWQSNQITFYVDGAQVNTVSQSLPNPMHVIFTNFTSSVSNPTPSDYPSIATVTYFTHWPLNGDGSCCQSTPDFTISW